MSGSTEGASNHTPSPSFPLVGYSGGVFVKYA